MTSLAGIRSFVSRWLDSVATALTGMFGTLRARKRVQVIEDDDGSFVFQPAGVRTPSGLPFERATIADGQFVAAHPESITKMLDGSHVELTLKSTRFLFKPLELPQRAGEFLDGVVRAQIDRLTPWNANEAAFGWSAPQQAGTDRIVVTVAATARALIKLVIDTLTTAGAEQVSVAAAPAAGATAISVYQHNSRTALDLDRTRRMLVAVLLGAGLLAGASLCAAAAVGYNLGSKQEELARRINERRASLRAGRDAGVQAATPLRVLERRKHQSPSSVIVLEVLSAILPEHTYVTELRIEGDKLRIVGVTRDAPGLIRLMEQQPHFTRATFFAPTTRGPSDPGERFHIEAQIEPLSAVRS